MLPFAAKGGAFVGTREQCNGCGGCRKDAPTMCPTFVATGEEIMSTRGRANAIRAVLELGGGLRKPGKPHATARSADAHVRDSMSASRARTWESALRFMGREATSVETIDPLRSSEMEIALSNCLSCKACTTECPSTVNMALLKAELLHPRHRRDGLPLRERLLGAVDMLGKLGCMMPGLANAALDWPWLRRWVARTLGITAKRPLPHYAAERFDHWFTRRVVGQASSLPAGLPAPVAEAGKMPEKAGWKPAPRAPRPTRVWVLLWDDTFVRYHEPQIGRAAVAVLEAAGFEVALLKERRCCGRPAFSQGNLEEAERLGHHNLELLNAFAASTPILFLEASCYSMFAEDYRELGLPGAGQVAERSFLFEQFIENLLSREPGALQFNHHPTSVAIHTHCHAKSLLNPGFMVRLVARLPGRKPVLLEPGCCGMAGAFGMLESKYELSLKVAEPLVQRITAQPPGTVVVASGTSCRHQIEHLTPVKPKHIAELLAEALG